MVPTCVLSVPYWRHEPCYLGSYPLINSSPCRHQAIIWTNAGILWNGPLGTNLSEILIKIHTFWLKKWIWKCRQENGGHFVSASMWDLGVRRIYLGHSQLTYRGRDYMTPILQMSFSTSYYWIFAVLWFRFHLNLFPMFSIGSYDDLVPKQATSHYLNQWLPGLLTYTCVTRPQWVK